MSLGERYQRDLLSLAAAMDARVSGILIPPQSFFHNLSEFFWTLTGMFLGWFLIRLQPARIANLSSKAMARFQAGKTPAPLHEESLANFAKMREAYESFSKAGGQKPAVFFVASHPKTTGIESRLSGDLIYWAVKLGEELDPGSKFALVQAVDDFALDMLPVALKGLYQGVMSASHLTINRAPGARFAGTELLLSGSYYTKTIFHILEALKDRKTVLAAIPGGVIHNARVLYGIRESARALYRKISPARRAGRRRRDFELALLNILTESDSSSTITGRLSETEKTKAAAYLKGWGVDKGEADGFLRELGEEIQFLSPFRKRLFHVLFSRLPGKGVPLLLIPLGHLNARGEPELQVRPGALVSGFDAKRGEMTWAGLDGNFSSLKTENWEKFVEKFIGTSFGFA